MKLVLVGVILVCWALAMWLARCWDVRLWNSGVCKHCGGKMKWFATASFGDRGYKCEHDNWEPEKHPHECVWISWPGVDEQPPLQPKRRVEVV